MNDATWTIETVHTSLKQHAQSNRNIDLPLKLLTVEEQRACRPTQRLGNN